MLTALILEDEKKNQQILTTMLERYCPQVEVLAVAAGLREGRRLLRRESPDVLLLDVELADGDCFELLESEERIGSQLIFVTAHSHYALRAIKFAALDYLLKPIVAGELQAAIRKVESSRDGDRSDRLRRRALMRSCREPNAGEVLALPTLDGYEVLQLADIMRFEAQGNYTTVITSEGNRLTVSKLIQDYELLLHGEGFYRIHKTHLINLRHVRRFVRAKGSFVIMSDGAKVDVAVRKREPFASLLRGL